MLLVLILWRLAHFPPAMSVVNDWHLPSSAENSQQRRLFSAGRLVPALGAAIVSAYTQYKLVPALWSGTNSVVQTASESPGGPSWNPAPSATTALPSLPLPPLLPPFLLWPFSTNNRLLNPGLKICSIHFYRGPEVGWIWKQIRNGIRVARKKWNAQLNLSFRETTHFGAGVSISKLLHGTYLYFKKVFRFLKFKLKWPLFSAKSGKLLWRDWDGLDPPVWWSEEQLRCFKHGRCRIQASPQTSESASVLSRDPQVMHMCIWETTDFGGDSGVWEHRVHLRATGAAPATVAFAGLWVRIQKNPTVFIFI